MKESARQKLQVISTAFRFFSVGVLVGVGAFAVWAKHVGMISDDIRLTFTFMLLLPAVLLLGHLPALILQISDGVNRMKQTKQD